MSQPPRPLPVGDDPSTRPEIDHGLEQHARDHQAESARQAGITRRMLELEDRMRRRLGDRDRREA